MDRKWSVSASKEAREQEIRKPQKRLFLLIPIISLTFTLIIQTILPVRKPPVVLAFKLIPSRRLGILV
jgi:hypothetical protein